MTIQLSVNHPLAYFNFSGTFYVYDIRVLLASRTDVVIQECLLKYFLFVCLCVSLLFKKRKWWKNIFINNLNIYNYILSLSPCKILYNFKHISLSYKSQFTSRTVRRQVFKWEIVIMIIIQIFTNNFQYHISCHTLEAGGGLVEDWGNYKIGLIFKIYYL